MAFENLDDAPVRPTPATVRNLHGADRHLGGLFASQEPHRHYFLRIAEIESTQGNRVTRRYEYKCSCGEQVS